MKRFVYKPQYAKLLVSMAGETSQIDDLARRIHVNAGHLRLVLEQLHKEEIIDKDKPGRDYQIKLTAKGEAISHKLAELMDLDNNWKEGYQVPRTLKAALVEKLQEIDSDINKAVEKLLKEQKTTELHDPSVSGSTTEKTIKGGTKK